MHLLSEFAIYSLNNESGLSVEIISKNIGDKSAPYGVGIHPYLTCNLAPVDGYMLQLPAKQVFAIDEHSNPTHLHAVDELDLNYLNQRFLGGKQIDHTFKTDRTEWEMHITDPQQALSVSSRSNQPWLQIYSGKKLYRRGLAVEPMSCPPNAFNSGIDLIQLSPEQQHHLFFNIRGEYI